MLLAKRLWVRMLFATSWRVSQILSVDAQGTYESKFAEARETALQELEEEARRKNADAVVGIDIDYEVLGANNGMLMVTATGTRRQNWVNSFRIY